MDDELTLRDKLACFIAARFALSNPVEVAEILEPFVKELLAEAYEAGWTDAVMMYR